MNAMLSQLAHALTARGWHLSTAESCTGGMIAAACTELAGSSTWYDRGFVTYSNTAKAEMLAVPASLIQQFGAVSEPVVLAMARGAAQASACEVAVAVTGIAGPTGGTAEKPVGTVWIAWHLKGANTARKYVFSGDRHQVRQATLEAALQGLVNLLATGTAIP